MMNEQQHRLLFVLHRALVEARLIAQREKCKQLFDLMDVLEIIPGMVARYDEKEMESVCTYLLEYRRRYPSPSFDYKRHLSVDPVPDKF